MSQAQFCYDYVYAANTATMFNSAAQFNQFSASQQSQLSYVGAGSRRYSAGASLPACTFTQSAQPAHSANNQYGGYPRRHSKPNVGMGGYGGHFQSRREIDTSSFHPGMKEVPMWLKALRLHKYTQLFQQMTYSTMMSMDEQKLEQLQVTKGARKKILQSLQKLRERVGWLKQLEKCIDDDVDTGYLILELRQMMSTPICAYTPPLRADVSVGKVDGIGLSADDVDEENLPGHIARILNRLHHHLFKGKSAGAAQLNLDDEYITKLLQVYDRLLNNDAFTPNQKQQVGIWKRVLRRYANEHNVFGKKNLAQQQSMQHRCLQPANTPPHLAAQYCPTHGLKPLFGQDQEMLSAEHAPTLGETIYPIVGNDMSMPNGQYGHNQPMLSDRIRGASAISTFDPLSEMNDASRMWSNELFLALAEKLSQQKLGGENAINNHSTNTHPRFDLNKSASYAQNPFTSAVRAPLQTFDNLQPLTHEEKLRFINEARNDARYSSFDLTQTAAAKDDLCWKSHADNHGGELPVFLSLRSANCHKAPKDSQVNAALPPQVASEYSQRSSYANAVQSNQAQSRFSSARLGSCSSTISDSSSSERSSRPESPGLTVYNFEPVIFDDPKPMHMQAYVR
ncbi:Sterile alpha motif containing protein [Aphelenchoides avenae]|nr:Sterile alpha motif containing protein [Aphelenchus avenae]